MHTNTLTNWFFKFIKKKKKNVLTYQITGSNTYLTWNFLIRISSWPVFSNVQKSPYTYSFFTSSSSKLTCSKSNFTKSIYVRYGLQKRALIYCTFWKKKQIKNKENQTKGCLVKLGKIIFNKKKLKYKFLEELYNLLSIL